MATKAAAKPAAAPAAAAPAAGAPVAKLAVVPETFLKKRKAVEELKLRRAKQRITNAKKHRATRNEIFKRAESYVKEYRQRSKNLVRMRREAKKTGQYFREPEAKVAFVIRIRGINCVDPKTRKILQLLRLRQVHNGVFVRLNKATWNMLRLVEPYVTYGPPTLKTVRELIYKRGFGKISKSRIPLTENRIIEKALGKYGLICIEDLVHEIFTCGPHFKQVTTFFWPFKLSSPLGGFKQKSKHFADGGDAGNREDFINNLVERMN